VKWALADHLGTVRDVVDSSGTLITHRKYDAFGNLVSGSTDPGWYLGYTGRFFDLHTGLQWNWQRWYDPKTGRWLSPDPINFLAGDTNLYRYVGNGPTNYTDPSGLVATDGQGPIYSNPALDRFGRDLQFARWRLDAIHDLLRDLGTTRDPEEQERLVDQINEIHRDYLDTLTGLADMLKDLPTGATGLRDELSKLPARVERLPMPEEINRQQFYGALSDACRVDSARLAGNDETLGNVETTLYWTDKAADAALILSGGGGFGVAAWNAAKNKALAKFLAREAALVGTSAAAAYGLAEAARRAGAPEPAIDVGMRVYQSVMLVRAATLAKKPTQCEPANKVAAHLQAGPHCLPSMGRRHTAFS
jgi:RHS repeat-associated protein